MTREEMLDKLSTLSFEYIDPQSDWEDIGFTERPIWVNSKGYGYLSCDDPSDNYWEHKDIDSEKWSTVRAKIVNETLEYEDIEGTPFVDLLDFLSFGDFCEDDDLCEYFEDLLDLPLESYKNLYCLQTFDGFEFFCSEDSFKKAYERDWCDFAWDGLDDDILVRWMARLFGHEV